MSSKIRRFVLTFSALAAFIPTARAQQSNVCLPVLTTVAGTGAAGFSGDGGPATAAQLHHPDEIVFDQSDNMYISDGDPAMRIRKIDAATQIITTVAGNGTEGFSGDGGPATQAAFGSSYGYRVSIALDASGDLYIGDYLNNRIRKVDAVTQVVTTIAGVDMADNGIYSGVPALTAQIGWPQHLIFDSMDNLYFGGGSYLKIDHATQMLEFLLDPLTTPPAQRAGSAVGLNDNIYIASRHPCVVERFDPASNILSTVAGNGDCALFSGDGGPALAAQLDYPESLAIDSFDNVYVNTFRGGGGSIIRKVDAQTQTITTVAGSGISGPTSDGEIAVASSFYSWGIALNSNDELYIADRSGHRIRKLVEPVLDDSDPCTIDQCDATGRVVHLRAENDGNACTVDQCDPQTGAVTHTPVPINDGNACTSDFCNPATGHVSHAPIFNCCTNNSQCGDSNPCNGVETCSNNRCVAGTPLASGSACSDGNACTAGDACNGSGSCSGAPVNIDDGNACTVDSCSPQIGVTHQPVPLNTSCDDGQSCTTGDRCLQGATANTRVCRGTLAALNASCNDNNACTTGDRCLQGPSANSRVCSGSAVNPDDRNPCTLDSCNPVTGIHNTKLGEGSSCSDGQPCNGAETCDKFGVCNPGAALADGASCRDGDACDGEETCRGGVCTGGQTASNGTQCAGVTAEKVCYTNGSCSDGRCVPPAMPNQECGIF